MGKIFQEESEFKKAEEYYKKAIHNYNISNYKIFLISNDIENAENLIKPLNLQYTLADNIYFKEKQQFYMLMLADVHIGANSSFSLMASYLNDIYNFNSFRFILCICCNYSRLFVFIFKNIFFDFV